MIDLKVVKAYIGATTMRFFNVVPLMRRGVKIVGMLVFADLGNGVPGEVAWLGVKYARRPGRAGALYAAGYGGEGSEGAMFAMWSQVSCESGRKPHTLNIS